MTIGGESAGAKLCGTLMGVPEAKPLFAQTILESGGAERIRSQANTHEVTAVFAKQFGEIAGAGAGP